MDEELQEQEMQPQEQNKSPENREKSYEEVITKNFKIISESAHNTTGLFPAVDLHIETPETHENHMGQAWIRDAAANHIGIIESAHIIRELDQEGDIATEMQEFVNQNLSKLLNFLNKPRWMDRFRQNIADHGSFTSLTESAPEVHMDIDGGECSWDQNQPEAWGQLLIAAGRAVQTGAIKEYSPSQREVIRAITQYLINIKPWKFEGAGMWEGLPAHSPSSRSNAIAIAKGLDAVAFLFKDDEVLEKQINQTILRSMDFVKKDINKDYTMPNGHPDGADLAMIVAMSLPESSEKTKLPFAKYVQDNQEKLKINDLPGAIRFISDLYKNGELGEARWLMANPTLSIGFAREAEKEFAKGNAEEGMLYSFLASTRLEQALEISSFYGHDPELYPELFMQRSPEKFRDNPHALIRHIGEQEVALQPLERSLLENSAFVMYAAAGVEQILHLTKLRGHSHHVKVAKSA